MALTKSFHKGVFAMSEVHSNGIEYVIKKCALILYKPIYKKIMFEILIELLRSDLNQFFFRNISWTKQDLEFDRTSFSRTVKSIYYYLSVFSQKCYKTSEGGPLNGKL